MNEKNPRILVVDDEKGARLITQTILSKKNFETVMAESGEDALKILEQDKNFDVILLDYLMVGLDGMQVLHTVKNDPATRHIRVIIVSSLSEPEEMVEAYSAGASDYIVKPFHAIELIARLETQIMLMRAGSK